MSVPSHSSHFRICILIDFPLAVNLTGGSLHTVLRQQQLVSVPEAARHPLWPAARNVRSRSNAARRRDQPSFQSSRVDSHSVATKAEGSSGRRRLLSNIPGYAEKCAGRQYGSDQLRGCIARDVWHSCVHCVHFRSGKFI